MAKQDSERINMRLRSEARFILEQRAEDWGISKTAVIERLLMATESPSEVRVGSRMFQPGKSVEFGSSDPAKIEGVSVGVSSKPSVSMGVFKCLHCGIMRAPKNHPLCANCVSEGHRGNVADCKECANQSGTGAL